MDALLIEDLTVRRSRGLVLRGIDLTVPEGSITGLLGPSGGGKTTLIRAVVGLQRITSGTVQVLGMPAGDRRLRSKVGYMTQAASVYTDLSAAANVRYHATIHGRNRAAADEALEVVGLTRMADRLVGGLSGGERSRVSLACALVARPRLLLLDEPTVGLDPLLRRDLWDLFRRWAAEQGVSILVSSHVMDEADRCDRLVLLRDGGVIAEGTPTRLRERTGEQDMENVFLALLSRNGNQMEAVR